MLSKNPTTPGPDTAPPQALSWSARTADQLAFVISAVASPFLVLPLFAAIVTAHHASTPLDFLWWGAIAVFCSTGLPFLYIFIGTRTGRITDLHVMRRDQRGGPFLVALLSSSLGALLLYWIGAPRQMVALGVAIVANGLAFGLITLRWKISMHPSVLTASALASALLVDHRFAAVLLLLPAVVWARVRRTRQACSKLHRHPRRRRGNPGVLGRSAAARRRRTRLPPRRWPRHWR